MPKHSCFHDGITGCLILETTRMPSINGGGGRLVGHLHLTFSCACVFVSFIHQNSYVIFSWQQCSIYIGDVQSAVFSEAS